MCYTTSIQKEEQDIQKHFNHQFKLGLEFHPMTANLGFSHNFTPIIPVDDSNFITLAQWGLFPSWAKDTSFQKNTLNAKIETITELPSFKNYVKNRCLIIADGFYEWKWLDKKGKQKEKYFITIPNQELFAFAGIYSDYTNKQTGETYRTYTIVTTGANEMMAEIHNTKKRMPVILPPDYESHWLNLGPIDDFKQIPIELIAILL